MLDRSPQWLDFGGDFLAEYLRLQELEPDIWTWKLWMEVTQESFLDADFRDRHSLSRSGY